MNYLRTADGDVYENTSYTVSLSRRLHRILKLFSRLLYSLFYPVSTV